VFGDRGIDVRAGRELCHNLEIRRPPNDVTEDIAKYPRHVDENDSQLGPR
jgi:hypothetical protein